MKKTLLFNCSLLLSMFLMAQTPVVYYPFNGNANDVINYGMVLLFNSEGKLLQQQTVSAQIMSMDMSKYIKGIYLLQYRTAEEVVNQKIIKK
jgi:hypothetical protein